MNSAARSALPGSRFFVLLALASGATDAFGYLRLGGTFTSVMTGNMVLFALSVVHREGGLVVRTASAIFGYLIGVFLGVRFAGRDFTADPVRTVRRLIAAELVLLAVYAVAFQIGAMSSASGGQAVLLGLAAIALGLQSCAVQSYGVSGLSTTFLTGTLTSVTIHLSSGRPIREASRPVLILAGLLVGAGVGTGIGLISTDAGACVPAAFVASAVVQLRAGGVTHQTITTPQQSSAPPAETPPPPAHTARP